ncbi:MAG: Asp-tRNA(Asn)/Glu-tRNA(Gln) amidotransferase subunit GatB [Bacilli bacterium]|nr:Asp-tRNA(Asn)/Glu-tRNA(Gln) amidotransferase subunit GatB [Bacilli bacterium]
MYKVVIGLEVHVELETNTKNFSSAPNKFTEAHNINVSTVDLGLPGILPIANKEAVRKALLTSMALHCKTPDEIIFDRKNYYYADLPKGYQITQNTKPVGIGGYLDVIVNKKIKRVTLHDIHLEEDTASLEHYPKYSLIDYNRSGVPLLEIVTDPCIESADEAVAYLEDLRDVFLYLGVSEARSNYGQMRCDVNISLMKETDTQLGTKVEMKNINAFNSVRQAIEYEIKRQSEILNRGEKVVQETRRIAEDGRTYSMREKVDAIDYKYFVEPNIPSTPVTDDFLYELKKELPELKGDRYLKYIEKYKMSEYDAGVIAKNRKISDYFETLLDLGSDVELSVNYVTTSILSTLKKLEIELEDLFITPEMLSGVIKQVKDKKLSLDAGKKLLYEAIDKKIDPNELIRKEGLSQINDKDELLKLITSIMDENKEVVRQYVEDGNMAAINFFIGQTMKKSNRQANPNMSKEIISEELERRKNESK